MPASASAIERSDNFPALRLAVLQAYQEGKTAGGPIPDAMRITSSPVSFLF